MVARKNRLDHRYNRSIVDPAWMVAAAALVAAVTLAASRLRLAREVAEARARLGPLEAQMSQQRRVVQQATLQEENVHFYSRFVSELAHVSRELHSGVGERRLPAVLLNIVSRTLEPQWALVLVRRRRSVIEPGRENFMIVAAASDNAPFPAGAPVPFGHGELGFVAEVQLTMSHLDFEAQPPAVRHKLAGQMPPGLRCEVVAPMVFGEETVGVLAIGRTKHHATEVKTALRLVAQIGALAMHDVTAYTDMKVTADVDGLTLVFNKRHMTRVLGEAIVTAQEQISCVSVFLFDIDNFKHYNDTNGHVAGDHLLQMLARLVQENTRRDNVFGRFGGEEFLLVLPGVRGEQALSAAENVRARICAHPFPFAEKQPLGCISVSGGVAEYPTDELDSNRLLQAADRALYEAKKSGRNRVLAAKAHYLSGEEENPPGVEPTLELELPDEPESPA